MRIYLGMRMEMEQRPRGTALRRLCNKLVRREVGCPGKPYKIEYVDGFKRPVLRGNTGRQVYHAPAYARKDRHGMIYYPSTLKIVVGAGWVCQALADHWGRLDAAAVQLWRILKSRKDKPPGA